MFICRRFLQLGLWAVLLGGCSNSPKIEGKPLENSRSFSTAEVIRLGPTAPEANIDNTDTLAQSGQLRPDIHAYAQALANERNLPLDRVQAILASVHKNDTVIRLISPASPDKKVWRSWQTYRSRFVEPKRIAWGIEFYQQHRDMLQRASERFQVPSSTIVAIIGVETLYGRDMGNFRTADALTTLAFNYPDTANQAERAAMFKGQLSDFITLVIKGELSADARGSYAGAIGMPQFMPGSIMRYAVDSNGKGRIDLSNDPADAIMSVANFLVEHGWRADLPVFVPVVLPANPAALVHGGLTPTLDWPALKSMGAQLAHGATDKAWANQPLGVIDLLEEAKGTSEYRTATPNFFALTHYNRSYFYATSVAELADAIDTALRRSTQSARR